LVVSWGCATANVRDSAFHPLITPFDQRMIAFADLSFHRREGDPPNLKVCRKGKWNDRMLIETVLSMLTVVCHFKKVSHRAWESFYARLALTMAAFNLCAQWNGFRPRPDDGFIPFQSLSSLSNTRTTG
jgi:hypothetical protein